MQQLRHALDALIDISDECPLVELSVLRHEHIGNQLLEVNSNSLRFSVRFGFTDPAERCMCGIYCRKCSELSRYLRNSPADGYDLTFLIAARHVQESSAEEICGAIQRIVDSVPSGVAGLLDYASKRSFAIQ